MVAASYTTDLNTVSLLEAGQLYVEFTGYALGDGAAVETDWYLQGSACASDEANNKTGVGHSIGVDYGTTLTFATDDCFFAWMQCMAGNAMATFANGGYRVIIGASLSDYNAWYVGGSDFGRNPYGGWTNVAVDPTYTPVDDTNGTPGAYRYFGVGFNLVNGISKGRPNCADAMRYGRGELIIEHGDLANGYGTMAGIATANDATSARWGLMQDVGGSYLWKGLMSFGNATNACDFRDSGAGIAVDDTPRTYAAFNRIEVNNASSRVDWTGYTFNALGTLSRGEFEAVDNATINKISCVFNDMSTFVYQSNSTMDTCVYQRCNLITQGGATFTDCTIDSSTDTAKAMLATNPSVITGCHFISDGTGHAMECATTGTYDWTDNTDEGYTGTRGTNLTPASGSVNAMFYNSSGGLITLNVSGGQSPSVRNSAGSTTQVNNNVTVTITVQDEATDPIENAQVAVYNSTTHAELSNELTNASGISSFSVAASTDFYARIRKSTTGSTRYFPIETIGNSGTTGTSLTVTLIENTIAST